MKTLLYQIIKYGFLGGLSACADTSIYWLLTRTIGINLHIANIVSTNMGILISFVLNRRYNFKKMDAPLRRALCFFSIGYLGLALSSLIIYLGTTVLYYDDFVMKLLSIFVVALIQFILNRTISFRKFNKGKDSRADIFNEKGSCSLMEGEKLIQSNTVTPSVSVIMLVYNEAEIIEKVIKEYYDIVVNKLNNAEFIIA